MSTNKKNENSNMPLISVLLYVNDNNAYIADSMESVLCQTYNNLEIVLLDDSAIEDKEEMYYNDFLKDNRIKVIKNAESKGFYDSVRSAVKVAEGEYISILRDYTKLSVDYYRLMVDKLQKEQADLALCDIARYSDNPSAYYYNMDSLRLQNVDEVSDALSFLMKQEGNIVGFYSYYNKLYKKKLLEKAFADCICDTSAVCIEISVMINLYRSAKKIVNIHNAYCFTRDEFLAVDMVIDFENEVANCKKICEFLVSEKISKADVEKFMVSYYMSMFLYHNCFYEEKIVQLVGAIVEMDEAKFKLIYKKMLHVFNLKTAVSGNFELYEKIKYFICQENVKYFGFDIFDTLVIRPFFEPTDLFKCLNSKFNELISDSSCIDFSIMRRQGEMACRGKYIVLRPCSEDVTLQEIYDFISEEYGIDKKVTDEVMKYEMELEYEFIQPRMTGKEFFDLALFAGKEVFIASDMYLSKEQIERMLKKCGYEGYKKLYVSNELDISKYSGNLFKHIKKELNVAETEKIGFLGDNYDVDVIRAQQNGYVSFHFPKTMDLFLNINKGIYSGEFFEKMFTADGGIIDLNTVLKFLGVRCMLAVVANKLYDNPYISYNNASDFNADPRIIGYFMCGMFLYAETRWILDKSIKDQVSTVHFVSRDGFYFKKCFDEFLRHMDCQVKSNYLYLSRKAIVPLYLEKGLSITEAYLEPHALKQSPHSIVKILYPVMAEETVKNAEKLCNENGFPYNKVFDNLHQYYCFTRFFAEKLYSQETYNAYISKVKPYFEKQISSNDVMFDVGYSGRAEKIISSLLGFGLNSNYFHTHEPMALMRKKRMGFEIDTFYSFKPASAFVTREQIFTPDAPSCIGFEFKEDGECVPRFEENKTSFIGTFLVNQMQESAVEFVKDFIGIFAEHMDTITINNFDACYPLEFYLHYAKDFDRNIFAFVDFEDDFGTNQILNVKDYWDQESEIYLLNKKFQQNDLVAVSKVEEEFNEKIIQMERDMEARMDVEREKHREEMQNYYDELHNVIDKYELSWTWKIGRVFVSIPGFIKRKIFRIKE